MIAALACIPGVLGQLGIVILTRNVGLLLWIVLLDAFIYSAARWFSRRWIGWAFAPAVLYLCMGAQALLMPVYSVITVK